MTSSSSGALLLSLRYGSHRGGQLAASVRHHDSLARRHVREMPQADVLARRPDLVAFNRLVIRVCAAQLIVFDLPRAHLSLSHFGTDHTAVGRIVPGPVHAIRELPADNLGAYFLPAQQSERLVSAGA